MGSSPQASHRGHVEPLQSHAGTATAGGAGGPGRRQLGRPRASGHVQTSLRQAVTPHTPPERANPTLSFPLACGSSAASHFAACPGVLLQTRGRRSFPLKPPHVPPLSEAAEWQPLLQGFVLEGGCRNSAEGSGEVTQWDKSSSPCFREEVLGLSPTHPPCSSASPPRKGAQPLDPFTRPLCPSHSCGRSFERDRSTPESDPKEAVTAVALCFPVSFQIIPSLDLPSPPPPKAPAGLTFHGAA